MLEDTNSLDAAHLYYACTLMALMYMNRVHTYTNFYK